ncbi:leucine rich domain-containing protein [Sarcoptes scabiei]|nr:leucine rich domain-containing protein [Sarcoptes scabiei]
MPSESTSPSKSSSKPQPLKTIKNGKLKKRNVKKSVRTVRQKMTNSKTQKSDSCEQQQQQQINTDATDEEKSNKSAPQASNKKGSTNRTQSKSQSTEKKTVKNVNNNVITNYFPIVSRRLLSAKLKEEEYQKNILHHVQNKVDPKEYLKITEFEDKGKAIIATAMIRKGSFICEYSGDLIDIETAKKREQDYEQEKAGCYMYYFNWNSNVWCVDATKPTGRYGRLINHSRKSPNCKTKIFVLNDRPHLIFIALKDINENEEILYDYGERDRMAIRSNPWLTTT